MKHTKTGVVTNTIITRSGLSNEDNKYSISKSEKRS